MDRGENVDYPFRQVIGMVGIDYHESVGVDQVFQSGAGEAAQRDSDGVADPALREFLEGE